MHSARFRVDSEIFNQNPINYLRSLLGNEVEILSWEKQSMIFPDGKIIIDAKYTKLVTETLKRIYIETSSLKKIDTQSNQYIFEYGEKKIPICLIVTDQSTISKPRIPVIIYPYNLHNKFYSYVARYVEEPLHSYSTITANNFNISKVYAEIEDVKIDKKKYSELYDEKETIEAYTKEIMKFDNLKHINTVVLAKSYDETLEPKSNIGFVIDYEKMPDYGVFGHVIIISHRKSNLLFYYPNCSTHIDSEHMKFIKKFMFYDVSNLPEKK